MAGTADTFIRRICGGQRFRQVWRLCLTASIGIALLGWSVAAGQRQDSFTGPRNHPAIAYANGHTDTAISRLAGRIADGTTTLSFDPANGYLASLLKALEISPTSQQVVFSHTSVQAEHISMANPRAIFFNDSTAVGWVRGTATIEIAAADPRQGTIFYTLEQQPDAPPTFTRQETCLQCHLTWETRGVPGWTVLSTFPMSDDPDAYASGITVDHATDLKMRWGGFFVTGRQVPREHLGNLPVVRSQAHLEVPPPTPVYQSLESAFDTKGFPSAFSDVAAGMVLAHQAQALNLMTRLGWETRSAAFDRTTARADVAARLTSAANELADYLLFVEEAPLERPLEGSSGFAEQFARLGPSDSRGRSLREISLHERLMRFPCSYTIYSPTFEALPDSAKAAVYRRMWSHLSGAGGSHLTRTDRVAIVEILRDTKPDLPSYFREAIR